MASRRSWLAEKCPPCPRTPVNHVSGPYKGPKRNQKVLAPSYGLRCAQVPSLRSCSVGTPPRAIHGPSRLSRHPCRSTHSTEPPLGLPGGLVDQKHCTPRRPTGRPVWRRDLQPAYFHCGSRACPRCRHLVLSGGTKCWHRGQARSQKSWCWLNFLLLLLLLLWPLDCAGDANAPHRRPNVGAVMGVARQDAAPAAMGHGWPVAACPHNSAGEREPASLGESAVW